MIATAFRGTIQAAGFVIDVPLIGEDEARRRVAALWRAGTTLRATPDGRWLVILEQPVHVRSENAPGLPLVAGAGGLAEPGLPAQSDTVIVSRHGRTHSWPMASLPAVSLTGWVDLGSLPVHRLTRLDKPPAPTPIAEVPVQREPDLRTAAKVRLPSAAARRLAKRRAPDPGRRAAVGDVVAVLLVAVLVIGVVIAGVVAAAKWHIPAFAIVLVLWLLAEVFASWANPQDDEWSNTIRSERGAPEWLTKLVMRSPIGWAIRGRHARYLHKLSEQFRQRKWDDALRDAIGLGSGGDGGWTWRVPRRRTSITPTLDWAGGGPGVAYGPEIFAELYTLYRKAADDLETAGRIEQAAFVYSDLLNDPAGAANLLERHDHLQLAAELAEGRNLDPDLVVRLWWRAGRRDRAITVARARGAFAGAVDRLSTVDESAALELRREWVSTCQQAGDQLAAVEAAWPEADLRPLVTDDIHAGIARGGQTAARLSAYLVAGTPTPAALHRALDLVADTSAEHQPERDEFIEALATLSSVDIASDRQVCTAVLRSVVRDGIPPGPRASTRRILRSLENRADPLAVADMAALTSRRRTPAAGPLRLTAPTEPGQLPVYDVATLPDGSILVAHGDFGARLLTPDGRVRARWDAPTQQLVVADHGGAALLLSLPGSVTQAHHLDLDSSRVRPWATLRAYRVLPSYDGRTLIVLDGQGIAFLDTLADRPRVVWRELDKDVAVHAIGRTPDRLTAVVTAPSPIPRRPGQVELWTWELPSIELRMRSPVPADMTTPPVVAGDQVLALFATPEDGLEVRRILDYGHRETDVRLPQGAVLRANGNAYLAQVGNDATVVVVPAFGEQSKLYVTFPTDAPVGLRHHAGVVNLWDTDGRIVCVDPSRPSTTNCLRTTL
jgi:hypothetical protein